MNRISKKFQTTIGGPVARFKDGSPNCTSEDFLNVLNK